MQRWVHHPAWWLAAVAVSMPGPLSAADRDIRADAPTIPFDIPAQPLATALDAFSLASGYQVLMSNFGLPAHNSAVVAGMFSPQEALGRLVAGTGFVARFTGPKAVILLPAPSVPSAIALSPSSGIVPYDATVQDGVIAALCQDAGTRPGDYRAALDLWITPSGRIGRAELLNSTGNSERDRDIVTALHAVALSSPPLDLLQPTTVLITPHAATADQCADDGRTRTP